MQTFFIKSLNSVTHFGKFIIIILFVPQLDIFFLLTADNCLILLFTPTADYETTCYLVFELFPLSYHLSVYFYS